MNKRFAAVLAIFASSLFVVACTDDFSEFENGGALDASGDSTSGVEGGLDGSYLTPDSQAPDASMDATLDGPTDGATDAPGDAPGDGAEDGQGRAERRRRRRARCGRRRGRSAAPPMRRGRRDVLHRLDVPHERRLRREHVHRVRRARPGVLRGCDAVHDQRRLLRPDGE